MAWNRPFKSYLRDLWTEDFAAHVLGHGNDFTSFKLKVAGRSKITRWIVESWGPLSSDIIKNGFLGSSITSELLCDIPVTLMDSLIQSASVVDVVDSDQDMSDDEEDEQEI